MNTTTLADKDMMTDMLDSQKMITGLYNTFANECAGAMLRGTMTRILDEEHTMQAQVFEEMQKRGWYPTTPAEQDKINAAKQKFSAPSN